MKHNILPYNPKLKELARKLRKQGILSEVILWKKIKGRSFGVEFHRQVPIDEYIVDFYCHELLLAVEIDGYSHSIEEVYENDKVRQVRLEFLGVNIVRFLDEDVKRDLNNVLRVLESKIAELQENSITSPMKNILLSPLQRGN